MVIDLIKKCFFSKFFKIEQFFLLPYQILTFSVRELWEKQKGRRRCNEQDARREGVTWRCSASTCFTGPQAFTSRTLTCGKKFHFLLTILSIGTLRYLQVQIMFWLGWHRPAEARESLNDHVQFCKSCGHSGFFLLPFLWIVENS